MRRLLNSAFRRSASLFAAAARGRQKQGLQAARLGDAAAVFCHLGADRFYLTQVWSCHGEIREAAHLAVDI
jgi:hypothetical protein